MKRVIVADDHSLFRDGITSLLEAAGYEVVKQVGDGESAINAIRELEPDLVLLDISMPNKTGIETLQEIRAEYPDLLVVMLTVSDNDDDLFSAIQAGANGYMLKDLNSTEFLSLLQGLESGEAALNRKMISRVMNGYQKLASKDPDSQEGLTKREIELLYQMVEGFSNKKIGERLFISENTVKYHIRNILQKLGVQNRTEAVSLAIRKGLLDI
jgi:DNA-binding NarL/FixJ family response regulator